MFLFKVKVFGFKTNNLKNRNFWSKGGLQQNGFLSTCVLQNVKSYRFFVCLFWTKLGDVQKHYKIGISARFQKPTFENMASFNGY